MRNYKINLIVNKMDLFSYDGSNTVAEIFEVLDEIEDPSLLDKCELKLTVEEVEDNKEEPVEDIAAEEVPAQPAMVIDPQQPVGNNGIVTYMGTPLNEHISTNKKGNKARVQEDFTESQDLADKLSNMLNAADVQFVPDEDGSTLTIVFADGDNWTVELSGDDDLDEYAEFLVEQIKAEKFDNKVAEAYEQNADGSYTIMSASDLAEDGYQIPLVVLKKNDENKFYAEQIGNSAFDEESQQIAQNVIDTAYKSGKDDKYILTRVDKTLNHNDPYFGVELNRSVVDTPVELVAAQALRTLRDDFKTFADSGIRNGKVTEDDLANKFTELTGVDYTTGKVINGDITVSLPDVTEEYTDKKTGKTKVRVLNKQHTFSGREQYDQLLTLLGKDPTDKWNYIPPEENPFVQRLHDLTGDYIDKLLSK